MRSWTNITDVLSCTPERHITLLATEKGECTLEINWQKFQVLQVGDFQIQRGLIQGKKIRFPECDCSCLLTYRYSRLLPCAKTVEYLIVFL